MFDAFVRIPVLVDGPSNETQTQKSDEMECGSRFCSSDSEIVKPTERSVSYLVMIYVPCILVSFLVIAIFLDPLTRYGEGRKGAHAEEKSLKDLILATFHQLRRPNQLMLVPITIFVGMEQAYIAAEYTQGFVGCTMGIGMIGFVMTAWGLGDSLFCFAFGLLMKYIGRPLIIMIGAAVNICVIGFKLHWHPESGITFYALAVLWGIGDAVWVTQINGLYGLIFRRNKEAAFASYRFFEACGFVFAFAISDSLCIKDKLQILYLTLTVGLIGYVSVEIIYQNKVLFKLIRTEGKSGETPIENTIKNNLAKIIPAFSTKLMTLQSILVTMLFVFLMNYNFRD